MYQKILERESVRTFEKVGKDLRIAGIVNCIETD